MQDRGSDGAPLLGWILDTDIQLSGPLDAMRPHERQRIVEIMAPALQAAFQSLIHDPLPELDTATASLFVLDLWLRHGIFQACRWPGSVFIVDGHNIKDGGVFYRSYNHDDAVRTPISEETRILNEIRNIFGRTRADLRIYDYPATMTPGVDMRWVTAVDVVDRRMRPASSRTITNPRSASFTVQDHVVIDEILSLFRYMFPPAGASASA